MRDQSRWRRKTPSDGVCRRPRSSRAGARPQYAIGARSPNKATARQAFSLCGGGPACGAASLSSIGGSAIGTVLRFSLCLRISREHLWPHPLALSNGQAEGANRWLEGVGIHLTSDRAAGRMACGVPRPACFPAQDLQDQLSGRILGDNCSARSGLVRLYVRVALFPGSEQIPSALSRKCGPRSRGLASPLSNACGVANLVLSFDRVFMIYLKRKAGTST